MHDIQNIQIILILAYNQYLILIKIHYYNKPIYSLIYMNTTACIYSRVSSTSDRQDTTRQVNDLMQYAQKNDINVLKVYEEHISGAKKIEERPVLSECLEYCVENHIGELLISELSRLGRSTLQVLRSLEMLHDNNISVYIQNIGLHSLQADGKVNPVASILITVLSEVASIERTNIQYRLNSGLKQYVEAGGKVGRKKGSVKPREKKESQYKEVISCLKKGYKIRDVAKLCNVGVSTVQRVKKEFVDVEV